MVYAQKLDTNDSDIKVSNFANSSKANATETPASATKANATETAASVIKANIIKTPADKELKYCYDSQFGSLGTGDGQFNRPHDIVFDSKVFYISMIEN
jgi:hypothetical protein